MIRIQNRGLDDQIDLEKDHIDAHNTERSLLNKNEIENDTDMDKDVAYILTLLPHHILEY